MKNRVSKNIVKALSVGIAASMALQPVAVYANDVNVGDQEAEKDPVDAAFDNASAETQQASDALVTTDESKNLEEQVIDGEKKEVHVPSADAATKTEKEIISGVVDSINPQLADGNKVSTDGYDTAISNIGDDKNEDGQNIGADAEVKDALVAIDDAKAANEQINKSIEESQEAIDSLNDGVTATPEKNGVKEAHQVNVDQYGVKADKEKKTEATGSIKDANNAETGFINAGQRAGEAAGQFNNVENAASQYALNGASSDISGSVLAGIKLDAEAANRTLEEANEILVQAENDLANAKEKKSDADIAYADAEKEFKQATKALKAVLGLDPDSDDVIPEEYLNTLDEKGNEELGVSAKKIELAKTALQDALTKLEDAKTARDNAKSAVETAVEGLNDAKYGELVAL